MAGFKEKIKGVISGKKVNDSPIIVLGPLSPEEEGDEIRKLIERGICPRDGHSFEGKKFCSGCGGNISKMMEAAKRFKP